MQWSTTGGDLRIPHFVGMHGLQVMLIAALLLAGLTRPTLIHPGTLTLTAAALLAALTTLATAAVLSAAETF